MFGSAPEAFAMYLLYFLVLVIMFPDLMIIWFSPETRGHPGAGTNKATQLLEVPIPGVHGFSGINLHCRNKLHIIEARSGIKVA